MNQSLSPGHHVLAASGQPVSGPWLTAIDGAMHCAKFGPGHTVVHVPAA